MDERRWLDLRELQLDMVLDLDVVIAPLYEDLDESPDFLLRGLVGDETPALDNLGDGVGQCFERRLVVEAQKHRDLRYGLGDVGVDGDLVLLEIFGDFDGAYFQLFEAQDDRERGTAVGKRDEVGDADRFDDGCSGDLVPDETVFHAVSGD